MLCFLQTVWVQLGLRRSPSSLLVPMPAPLIVIQWFMGWGGNLQGKHKPLFCLQLLKMQISSKVRASVTGDPAVTGRLPRGTGEGVSGRTYHLGKGKTFV